MDGQRGGRGRGGGRGRDIVRGGGRGRGRGGAQRPAVPVQADEHARQNRGGRGAAGGAGNGQGRGQGGASRGRGGGGGPPAAQRDALVVQPTVQSILAFLSMLARWDTGQVLYELTGRNMANFTVAVDGLLSITSVQDRERVWGDYLLPILGGQAFLSHVQQEQVNQLLALLLRPAAQMSLRVYITLNLGAAALQTRLDGVLITLLRLCSFTCALIDRRPEDAVGMLPIPELRAAVQAAGLHVESLRNRGTAPNVQVVAAIASLRASWNLLERRYNHYFSRQQEEAQQQQLDVAAAAERRRQAVDVTGFRGMTILPDAGDLWLRENPRLPTNRVAAPWESLEQYLGTHFVLLREDCIRNLRQGVQAYRDGAGQEVMRGKVNLYTNIRVGTPSAGRDALGWVITITPFPRPRRPIDWTISKRLMTGSLLCLLPADVPPAQSDLPIFATVMRRDDKLLSAGLLEIEITDKSREMFDPTRPWVMLESATFFDPYNHVMKVLQAMPHDPTAFPFHDLLLGTYTVLSHPGYLAPRLAMARDADRADAPRRNRPPMHAMRQEGGDDALQRLRQKLKAVSLLHGKAESDIAAARERARQAAEHDDGSRPLPPRGRDPLTLALAELDTLAARKHALQRAVDSFRTAPPTQYLISEAIPAFARAHPAGTHDITLPWPHFEHGLDDSQLRAVQMALKSNLSIIQGPPGCGKTYVGVLISKLLLDNSRSRAGEGGKAGPILYVCLTNHALDQLLEFVLDYEPSVIRIGGRSKSEKLQDCTLDRRTVQVDKKRAAQAHEAREEALAQLDIAKELAGATGLTQDRLGNVSSALPWAKQQVRSLYSRLYLVDETRLAEVAQLTGGDWQVGHGRGGRQQRREHAAQAPVPDIVARWLHVAGHGRPAGMLQFMRMERDRLQAQAAGQEQGAPRPDLSESDTEAGSQGTGEDDADDAVAAVDVRAEDEARQDALGQRLDEEPQADGRPRLDGLDGFNPRQRHRVEAMIAQQQGRRGRNTNRRGRVGRGPPGPPEVLPAHELVAVGGAQDPLDDSDDETEAEQALLNEIDLKAVQNVWQLSIPNRQALVQLWCREMQAVGRQKLVEATVAYNEAAKRLRKVYDEADAAALRKAAVIGLTTSGAARWRNLIALVQPSVLIVEEAAEVLESHILASMPLSCQHMILIGDHKQLRPSVEVYDLERLNANVSMFERLVNIGVPHVTLNTQHRMRPAIADLIRPSVYETLHDHESVIRHPHVRGMSKDVFFFHHTHFESKGGVNSESMSTTNRHEADMAVHLAYYLLRNKYKPKDMVILTGYQGQQQLMRNVVKDMQRQVQNAPGELLGQVRISTIDNYQGEEADVVILSLVRNNKDNVPGFLRDQNRTNVALSRARHGLYILGNADLLHGASDLWASVIGQLDNREEVGTAFKMQCQKHPRTYTEVSVPADFAQVRCGGCNVPCGSRLECGHVCPQTCHPDGHEDFQCLKQCERKHEGCGHNCPKLCYEACGDCNTMVTKVMPNCGHEQQLPCHQDPGTAMCTSKCPRRPQGWSCNHACPSVCGRQCPERCLVTVQLQANSCPTGHQIQVKCFENKPAAPCAAECGHTLDCGHPCRAKCGDCTSKHQHSACSAPCRRPLLCGHPCPGNHPCSLPCMPCIQVCETKCAHSQCERPCAAPCAPCVEPCTNRCPHGECSKLCHEVCDKPACDLPCPYLIPRCGHPCIGLCGEPCPSLCRICDGNELEIFTMQTLKEFDPTDRFIQLQGCGHVLEVSGLDQWMAQQDFTVPAEPGEDGEPAKPKKMQMPFCFCKATVWHSVRYGALIHRCRTEIDRVKGLSDARSFQALVMRELQSGTHKAAEQVARTQTRTLPDWAVGHVMLGVVLAAGGESQASEAEAALKHGLELVPKLSADAQSSVRRLAGLSLAKVLMAASKREEAERVLLEMRQDEERAVQGPSGPTATRMLSAPTLDDIDGLLAQMVVQRVERGYYFRCPNGHPYLIGECGGATEASRCPECRATIGGGGHTLAAGNRRAADMDDRGATAWDRMAGLAPDAHLVARVARGELDHH